MLRPSRIAPLVCLSVSIYFAGAQTDAGRIGVPHDWSHRHTIFSQPATWDGLAQVQSDPRYWQQLNWRNMAIRAADPGTGSAFFPPPGPDDAGDDDGQGAGGQDHGGGDNGFDNPAPGNLKVDWGESMGTAALSYTGLENYPAKYSFNVANPVANCTGDYVVFALPTATATRFNLIAFNKLYVNNTGTGTCAGTVPGALFAYNASQNGGPLSSSPALSLDGTQIALIENASSAQFHVVKWKSGNVSATFGSPFNAAKMTNCATNGAVAPCEYSVVYSTHTAKLSSPYIDYATDTAWVTDDAGLIAAISPVFGGGTPVVKSSVTISGSSNMTPPIYDAVSKNVFVADGTGKLYYLRTAAASAGACLSGSPPCRGSTTLTVSNKAVIDSPVVDSSSGTVFVFSNGSSGGSNSSVVQTNTVLGTSKVATIGPSGSQTVRAGTFSNAYYTSPASGLLYACGTNASNIPQLYAISFTGTTMNAGAAGKGPLSLATATAACSSPTEVFNQTLNRDELYLGVTTKCTTAITGGCVKRFDITSGFPAAAANTVSEAGGTAGIVIDNVSDGTSGNASQTNLYFVTQNSQSCSKYTSGTASTSGCAVKLTQAALQ